MRTAGLEALYARAVVDVRQCHLDRLRAIGVRPATIARLGTAYPPFGVLCGSVGADGLFAPGDGAPHVIMPVVEGCGLIDLVAWRVATPARWGTINGLGWLLNADHAFASRWDGDKLELRSTPLAWLMADATGAVVLDWESPDLCWLRGFDRIDCDSDMVAATLRRSLQRPVRMPRITGEAVRHVA